MVPVQQEVRWVSCDVAQHPWRVFVTSHRCSAYNDFSCSPSRQTVLKWRSHFGLFKGNKNIQQKQRSGHERVSASQRVQVTSRYIPAHARRVVGVNSGNVDSGSSDMRVTIFDLGPNHKIIFLYSSFRSLFFLLS